MMKYYLLFGSNIGNSKSYIEKAKYLLSLLVSDHMTESSMYHTEPWGETAQKYFLNQVIELNTHIQPLELMSHIKRIETLLGKRKETKYGPRTIDIDILLCDQKIIDHKNLIVPHPRMHKRAFTLIPLTEITKNLIHPRLNKTMEELLSECEDTSEVSRVK